MIQETQDLLSTLERLTNQLVKAMTSAPLGALDWRPGPETSSAAVLFTHTLGASRPWLVSIVAGETSDRVREREFEAVGPEVGDARERADRWLADARRILEPMSTADLDRPCRLPSSSEPWMETLTARGAVLHVVEHIGMHIAHLELTLQLWHALQAGAGAAG
jgi:uncharacterized damage-inducible protein DinB